MSTTVTATFVFTDLVDSTATAARLGPAGAEALRQTHFRLLRGAVTASGGTEVKNLGDGLMVMYSSPSRALAGAVGMAQAVEHHNRSSDEPLGVRIGMGAGEATEEDGDFFGDPVVVAARLCAAAAGGQILAADIVRSLVGRHSAQTFEIVGPLTLKGLPEPVDVVEVVWEPTAVEGSVPVPSRLLGAATDALFGFFGRTAELNVLDGALKTATSSRRAQVVFIAGEAGMGKTALTAQFARTAHAEGVVVTFGHSDEDLGVAYQPWIEALSYLARLGDPEWTGGLRAAQRSALTQLVPEIRSEGDRVTDPETERLLLLEGATELLVAASVAAPVVVVLDDLHWADTASLQLLRHVIGSATPMSVVIVCTYRDTDLTRGDPLTNLLADLHREANVARISLAGLEDVELVELLAAAAGHPLDDDGVGLAHVVRRETGGNPFFTAEILRHLGETGGIVLGEDGRWALSGTFEEVGLPSSVRDVVGRRVERLGDDAVRVLRLAAVIGREFDVDLLATLADVGDDPLLDLLDAAVSAAVLVESDTADRYRFAHALTQHSLYDDLSPARRRRAHQRAAEALEARAAGEDPTSLSELARHWVAATAPTDLDKALGYLRRAGDAARDALAPDDAIGWYQQALDLLDGRAQPVDQQRRAEVLAELGTTRLQAGHPDGRDALLESAAIARELDDTRVLVRAALGFIPHARTGDEDARPVIQAALDRVGAAPTATRARLLASLAHAHDSALEWRVRQELSMEAMDVARKAGDDPTFVDVLAMTFVEVATPERRDQVVDDVERAVVLARRIGDPVLLARIGFQLMWVRCQQADNAGADALLAELEALSEAIGLPHQEWQVALLAAGRLLLAGHADRAEVANERALELGLTAGAPDAFGAYGGILYTIRQHQGRLDEIADMFVDAARDNPSIAVLRGGVTAMLCQLGRFDEAQERLVAEAATDFDFPYDQTWLASMSDHLDVAATTGDHAVAKALVDRAAPFAGHIVEPGSSHVLGAFARPLGRAAVLLGDLDRAEQWFATAHDLHERLRAPYWIARGQLDHADLCLARRGEGDLERARSLASEASTTAGAHGCATLLSRAEALLAGI